MQFRILVLAILTLSLTACGSGGSSSTANNTNTNNSEVINPDPLNISVSPDNLQFTVEQGTTVPAPQTITVSYNGEAVGFELLTTDVSWLSFETINTQTSSFTVEYSILTTNLTPGNYEAVIQYKTGPFDQSAFVTHNFTVNLTVTEPPAPIVILPPTPGGLNAISQPLTSMLSWSAALLAEPYDNLHYNLYWSTTPDTSLESASKIQVYDTQYIHFNLSSNVTYYYQLTVVVDGLESLPTPVQSVIVGEVSVTPGIPANIRSYSELDANIIMWDGAIGAEGFDLYWSIAPFSDLSSASRISNIVSPYRHTSLTLHTDYYYKLIATNQFGESAASSQFQQTPSGSVIRQLHSEHDDTAVAIASDQSGNIYTLGETLGDLAATGIEPTSLFNAHPFITKHSDAGDLIWIKQIDFLIEPVYFNDLTVDASGNIYLTGYTIGDYASPKNGSADLILAKFDTNFTLLWKKQYAFQDKGEAIELDSTGNIYIASTNNSALTNEDIYLRKFDTSGNFIWESAVSTLENEFLPDLSIDSYDNILLSGGSFGDLFNHASSLAGRNSFLIKFSTDATRIWEKLVHNPAVQTSPYSITTDAVGNIYMTGTVYGSSFDGAIVRDNSQFLIKLSSDGVNIWDITLPFSSPNALIADNNGNALVTGQQIKLNGGTQDILSYTAKYEASDGTLLSSQSFTTSTADGSHDITINSLGNIFIAGYTGGNIQGSFDTSDSTSDSDAFIIKVGMP